MKNLKLEFCEVDPKILGSPLATFRRSGTASLCCSAIITFVTGDGDTEFRNVRKINLSNDEDNWDQFNKNDSTAFTFTYVQST
jgi:hypothetical protein